MQSALYSFHCLSFQDGSFSRYFLAVIFILSLTCVQQNLICLLSCSFFTSLFDLVTLNLNPFCLILWCSWSCGWCGWLCFKKLYLNIILKDRVPKVESSVHSDTLSRESKIGGCVCVCVCVCVLGDGGKGGGRELGREDDWRQNICQMLVFDFIERLVHLPCRQRDWCIYVHAGSVAHYSRDCSLWSIKVQWRAVTKWELLSHTPENK